MTSSNGIDWTVEYKIMGSIAKIDCQVVDKALRRTFFRRTISIADKAGKKKPRSPLTAVPRSVAGEGRRNCRRDTS